MWCRARLLVATLVALPLLLPRIACGCPASTGTDPTPSLRNR
jgi:hypothetical protein